MKNDTMTSETEELPAEEISQMQKSHIIDNGEKREEDDRVIKKLNFLQEKILEMEARIEKIDNRLENGGSNQPAQKFTVDDLYVEEKKPGAAPSELGQDLLGTLNQEQELSISEFMHIMKRNGMHATRPTYLNWMDKIASKHETIEFKSGSRGGDNKPSRLIKDYSDFE